MIAFIQFRNVIQLHMQGNAYGGQAGLLEFFRFVMVDAEMRLFVLPARWSSPGLNGGRPCACELDHDDVAAIGTPDQKISSVFDRRNPEKVKCLGTRKL